MSGYDLKAASPQQHYVTNWELEHFAEAYPLSGKHDRGSIIAARSVMFIDDITTDRINSMNSEVYRPIISVKCCKIDRPAPQSADG